MPTIAAVNGAAIGAGLCLALACDLRYAAAGARLGVPFVKLGMHAGMGGTYLLPEVVGEAHARDLLLTGRVVDADEALRIGPGLAGARPGDVPATTCCEIAAGIAATAPDRHPADQARAPRTAATPTSSPPCSGRRWPSRSRWPPRTSRRASAASREKRPPEFRGR